LRDRLALALLALAVCATACARAEAPRPNLLLVTIDTLRADRLACYGGPADVGREICALGAQGVRFAWAIAPAPYTGPSIASLLSSRLPAHHGVVQDFDSFLAAEIESVAELLGAAGYRTAAVVSNPVLDRSRGFDQGFSLYDQRMTSRERNRPSYAERPARDTTDAALAWLAGGGAAPWFLWVHYQDPHGPYTAPGSQAPGDAPGDAPLPVGPDDVGYGGIPRYQALPGIRTLRAYEARYQDEIRYVDAEVGRLVRAVDAAGARVEIALTADHGEAFGENGYYFVHGHSVGLDQVRVPLFWRRADAREPRVVETPVSLVDVAPTLLRVAGVEAPAAFQGRALPLSGDAAPDPERPIFAEHGRRVAVIHGDAYYSRYRTPRRAEARHAPGEPPLLPFVATRLSQADPEAYDAQLAAPLEPVLAEYLRQTKHLRPRRGGQVSEDDLARMRALGYSE
jgi:arylsulfatase A-like enzyme